MFGNRGNQGYEQEFKRRFGVLRKLCNYGSQWKGSNWREKVEVSLNWMQETDEELELSFILVECIRQIPVTLLLFSCSVVTDSLRPHTLQHIRLPSPSYSPGVCSNSCPLNQWCHPTIMSSVTLFSSCLQSFPVSGFCSVSFGSSHQVAKVLELQLQHQSFQCIFRVDFH